MTIINSSNYGEIATELVATVGFFDGVHLGHRFLIDLVKKKAAEENRKSAVVTFSDHPRKVLHADFQPQLLTSLDEKIKLIESTGVDFCILLDFNLAMSKLNANEFLSNIVYNQLKIRTIFIGHDHKFGHNRSEGFDEYKKYGSGIGLNVLQAERFSLPKVKHISSTDIRNALSTADIVKANLLLNYEYNFTGIVTTGFKIGRKIGFPTANLEPVNNEKIIPAPAVYAVKINYSGQVYFGMMNIGIRPTIDNGIHTTLEVNIFDFDEDIYHKELTVSFVAKIRNEQKFDSVEQLTQQLHADKEQALIILNQKK